MGERGLLPLWSPPACMFMNTINGTRTIILNIVDERFSKRKAVNHLFGMPLSKREAEVLRLIAIGETNKSMAGIMSISIKTVEKFRTSLTKKLDIYDIASLTQYALATGVVGNKYGGNHGQ